MKIEINDHRKVFAIQEEFGKLFPNLRIEFLAKPNKVGSQPSKKQFRAPGNTLGDCRVLHSKGVLTLSSGMTVADLKETLSDIFGLSITVLRKSNGQWVETTENGSRSLEEQNKQ